MIRFGQLIWILFILLGSCRDRKVQLVSDENISLKDLITVTRDLRFPILINDSIMNRKENDSSKLHIPTFQKYLPDSVFQKQYPVTKQLQLFVLGKTMTNEKGTYFFVKSIAGKKRAVHLYYFTPEQRFLGTMKLADNSEKVKGVNRYCRMDSRFNIAMVKERKMPTGEMWTGETIYYMNTDGKMIVAMTNTNEDLSDEILGNPIDTLPRKHKYSADYSTNSKNLVSIRDGERPKTFLFFIHFSKQEGECVGELKGEGEWVSENRGVFHDNNSPCVVEFTFSKKTVIIKETDGCGSYRGITCFFEGSYPKVKQVQYSKAKGK